MSSYYDIDFGDGTAQSERFPKALRPGYFAIDEMSREQLLVLGKRLAENLKFIDLRDEWDGDSTWEDLFAKDPAFVLAEIASTDTAKLEAQYRACVALQSLTARAEFINGLAVKIDNWSRVLRVSNQPQIEPINAEISQIIANTLAGSLVVIDRVLSDELGEIPDAVLSRRKSTGALWVPPDSGANESELPDTRQKRFRHLDTSFHRFVGAISYLKSIAGASLDPGTAIRDQNPAVALFIAFLKLYSRAQQTINNFPVKRLDFYYTKLLQASLRSRLPDKVHLALTLAPGQPPVVVPKGTRFLAGKNEAGKDIEFVSDEDLALTDAAVSLIRTFYLESDPLISPQHELGCVTRIRADELDVTSTDGAGMPLFGAGDLTSCDDAEIGIAIASPLLHLREGKRKIVFDIECEPDENVPGTARDATKWLTNADSADEFRRRLGQVFAWKLMSGPDWPSEPAMGVIKKAASMLFGTGSAAELTENHTSLDVIFELLKQLKENREALFYRLFRDAFEVRLTTKAGWTSRNHVIAPLPQHSDGSLAGLRLELSLSEDDPAIAAYDRTVHGGDFSTDQPLASLRMKPSSMFYAYSLFAALDMKTVNIDVDVRGARALVAYSDLGQLDSSKPFGPFGPQPSRDSYLAIGNYEAARKPLSQAHLNIDWGGLPREFGGFEEYYRGYKSDFGGDSFKVRTSVLAHNGWNSGESDSQALFSTVAETGQIAVYRRLDLLRGQRYVALESTVPESDYRLDNFSRSGFFRIDLSPSENAFGHSDYPQLMTEVLTANAKRRKPLPLPQPPYTPMINKLSLDYSAHSSIRFRTQVAPRAVPAEDKLFHEHPFGTRELVLSGSRTLAPLMPRFHCNGYLLLGISSSGPPSTISLLFDLRGGDRKSTDQPIVCDWFYLSGNEFKRLPQDAVLRDTTANFTFSGIVTIELPDDIDSDNTILRGEYYWISIGARGGLRLCPRLHSVKTGGLNAVRKITDNDTRFAPLASGSISEAISAPAGIGRVEQPADSFGGRPAEERDHLITRTSERLHHKDRACQPWDYERLVLERFPDLYKVKCFANMTTTDDRPMPGEVLIVVVPRVRIAGIGKAQRLLVNPWRLDQIRRYLSEKSSQFANITVRNPVYELVQVRCSVKLVESLNRGKYVRELNQVISDFISPWRAGGYGANFGWRIRQKDIEAHIGALSYVEFITGFSMLHITQDNDQYYCLLDTARTKHAHIESFAEKTEREAGRMEYDADEIAPRYPWSLVLPSRRHFIETMTEIGEVGAKAADVGELEVGSTLILDAESSSG